MTVLSALPRPPLTHDPVSDTRLLLEELWRQQVDTVVELSRDTLTPGDANGYHANELLLTNKLLAVARQQLADTEAALARLKDGSYGACAQCTRPISPERLEVLPAARYCVTCQAAHTSRS
jgi:RNA polymerase-binding transcription factor DksA